MSNIVRWGSVWACVIWLLVGCAVPAKVQMLVPGKFITRQAAISTALEHASSPQPELSGAQVAPTNFQAQIMTLSDASRQLDLGMRNDMGNQVVWLVRMDGVWHDDFPRPADVPKPPPLHHYAVILDASSGTMLASATQP